MEFLDKMKHFITQNMGANPEDMQPLIDAMSDYWWAAGANDTALMAQAEADAAAAVAVVNSARASFLADEFREIRVEKRDFLHEVRDLKQAVKELREVRAEQREAIREARDEGFAALREAKQDAREAIKEAKQDIREARQDRNEARQDWREAVQELKKAINEWRDGPSEPTIFIPAILDEEPGDPDLILFPEDAGGGGGGSGGGGDGGIIDVPLDLDPPPDDSVTDVIIDDSPTVIG